MQISLKCEACDKMIEDGNTFVHHNGEYFHINCYWLWVQEQLFRLEDLDR